MRPRKEFDLDEVEKLAGFGMTYEEMAAFLECGVRTIERRVSDEEGDFRRAYKKGQASLKMSLRRQQIALAEKGNATMLIWLGKQLLGQSDKVDTKSKIQSTQNTQMRLTPEIEAQIKEAAQIVHDDPRL